MWPSTAVGVTPCAVRLRDSAAVTWNTSPGLKPESCSVALSTFVMQAAEQATWRDQKIRIPKTRRVAGLQPQTPLGEITAPTANWDRAGYPISKNFTPAISHSGLKQPNSPKPPCDFSATRSMALRDCKFCGGICVALRQECGLATAVAAWRGG